MENCWKWGQIVGKDEKFVKNAERFAEKDEKFVEKAKIFTEKNKKLLKRLKNLLKKDNDSSFSFETKENWLHFFYFTENR